MSRLIPPVAREPGPLAPGTGVGRYLVLEGVGGGALGAVYTAWDPQLKRKVALQILRPGPERGLREQEAHAAARLLHPNVVAIHDVGAFGESVFLTLEFSEGGTLRDWLAAEPRGVREIVRLLRQAGEGLAAAHDAGLLHGAPGPESVLLDGKGRARISGFGFADPGADALSDQAAFARMLAQALSGARDRVPGWLSRVAQRGQATDPAKRFPSLRALLLALDRGLAFRPRRAILGLGLAVMIAAGLALWLRAPRALCTGGEVAWGAVWDAAHRQQVREAFAASGGEGGAAWEGVDRGLRDLRRQWLSSYQRVCEATHLRGAQSGALLDVRMRCLADRRDEVVALAELFAGGDRAVVGRAGAAVLALPAVDACERAREVGTPVPAAILPAVERLSAQLARANALNYAGSWEQGLEVAKAALAEARPLGQPALTARLLLVAGKLERKHGNYRGAEAMLNEAAALAVEARDDLTAAEAWISETGLVGFFIGRTGEARNWARYAEAALARAGERGSEREADLLRSLASVLWRREHKREEALELYQRARAMSEKLHGDHADLQVIGCDEGIAGVYFDMARGAEALELHLRVLQTQARLFGAQHRSLAVPLVNVGEDLVMLGRLPEAFEYLNRALALAGVGTTPADGYYHHRLALAHRKQGSFERALAEDDRALQLLAEAGLRGDYWEAAALTGRGLDLIALGRAAEAVDPLERALRQQGEQALPSEAAETEWALGRALHAAGGRARGVALVRRAAERLRPEAERYGSWYRALQQELDAWLARHRA